MISNVNKLKGTEGEQLHKSHTASQLGQGAPATFGKWQKKRKRTTGGNKKMQRKLKTRVKHWLHRSEKGRKARKKLLSDEKKLYQTREKKVIYQRTLGRDKSPAYRDCRHETRKRKFAIKEGEQEGFWEREARTIKLRKDYSGKTKNLSSEI